MIRVPVTYRQSEFMLYATLKNKNWEKEDASWAVADHDQALSGHDLEKGTKKGMKKGTISPQGKDTGSEQSFF